MNAKSSTLPPIPAKTGPGRKRSGPVPAWGLKLGGVLTTLGIFVGSFGYAGTHLYVTNAPLQPATVAAVATTDTTAATAASATAVQSTASTSTTTLTSTVRTTTRTAVTKTASS
jgi:autotransporter adhesin